MARYYGAISNFNLALLGLLWLLALQLGGSYLHAYFNIRSASIIEENGESPYRHSRLIWLFIAYAFLAITASLSVLVIRAVDIPGIFLLMLIIVLGVLIYTLPPFQLVYSGYGELIFSLLVANMTPALGYQLQGGDSLRLLAMVTFPLTVLHLAMLLAFSLHSYASDMKYSRRTLILRMGWQNGVPLHNILILSAYLLLLLAITFGLPWRVGVPALFTLPIGIFQIVIVNRIAAGVKPPWKVLDVLASALFGITAYLLTFGFWIR
jgi:1,4-dihydroxy-2-naphthoate octaprenyltransferase